MPTKRAVSCMSSTRCKRSRRAACWDLAPALASLLADSLHSYGHAAPGRHLVHGGLRRRTVDSGQRLGAGTLQDEKKFGRNTSAQKVFSAGLLRVRPETTRRGNVQISTIENTGLKSRAAWPRSMFLRYSSFLANQRSVHARLGSTLEQNAPAMRSQVHCACALCRAP